MTFLFKIAFCTLVSGLQCKHSSRIVAERCTYTKRAVSCLSQGPRRLKKARSLMLLTLVNLFCFCFLICKRGKIIFSLSELCTPRNKNVPSNLFVQKSSTAGPWNQLKSLCTLITPRRNTDFFSPA